MALDSAKKAQIVAKFARKEGDTGSPEVQIALLTARITELTEHLKIFKKDFSSRLGLLKLVGQRKRLLKYLKNKDYTTYSKLISELGLRDKWSIGERSALLTKFHLYISFIQNFTVYFKIFHL